MNRDFLRIAKKNFKGEQPELIKTAIEMLDTDGGVSSEKLSMLLAHEVSAWLGIDEPNLSERSLLNGGADRIRACYNNCKSMP